MRVINKQYMNELSIKTLNEYMHNTIFIDMCDEALTLPDVSPVIRSMSYGRSLYAKNKRQSFDQLSQRDNPYGCVKVNRDREPL